jgi:hypothetical protein|tara:strand:+ start:691 stop:912 length:222 start_codon:yes stop_codon:yes gene_type:complete
MKVEIDHGRNDTTGVILDRRAQRIIRISSFRLVSPSPQSISMFQGEQKQQDTGTPEISPPDFDPLEMTPRDGP